MFDKIDGLPLHPLLVHLPVVLIPITALLAVLYVLLPGLRSRVGWVLVLAAIGGAGTAWAAAQAGEKMAENLTQSTALTAHAHFGELLWQYAILLAVAAVALVGVDSARRNRATTRRDDEEYGYSHRRSDSSGGMMLTVVSLVLSLGLLGAAGVAGYQVFRTGHTGAQMVWGQR